jgi:hypothetical protein
MKDNNRPDGDAQISANEWRPYVPKSRPLLKRLRRDPGRRVVAHLEKQRKDSKGAATALGILALVGGFFTSGIFSPVLGVMMMLGGVLLLVVSAIL